MLVLGGAGFIGRHAVSALASQGANVTVGTSHPDKVASRLHANSTKLPCHVVRVHKCLEPAAWQAHIQSYDAVLNCVGVLRPVGRATYAKVHTQAPAALAECARDLNKRLVHISALGLHADAGSRFITSKLNGEEAIKAIGGDWIIARPSLIDGEGGFGARWLRGVAALPFFVAPSKARGQIAALDAEDLGEALARLCLASAEELRLSESREFELGGTQSYGFAEYIHALRSRRGDRPAYCLNIPSGLARFISHICDGLHFTPFSYGHHELLHRDNVPNPNRLPELLGRAPKVVA